MSMFELIKNYFNIQKNASQENLSSKERPKFSEPSNSAGAKLPCGLYYGEVILLNWMVGKKEKDKLEFPLYFTSYGINPLASLQKLKDMNLIRISSNFEGLFALKNKDLQEILRDNSLKVSGKKSELIERITANINETDLNFRVPSVYVLTNEGQKIITQYNIFIWAHKNASFNSEILSPIDFIDSWQLNDSPENIAFHKVNRKLNNRINSKSYNYFYNLQLMESLLYKYSNNIQHTINEICLCFLESFNLIEEHKFIVTPSDLASQIVQTKIINLISNTSLDKYDIEKAISNFINKYQDYFSTLKLNNNIFYKMFDIAKEKNTEEFNLFRIKALLLMSRNK